MQTLVRDGVALCFTEAGNGAPALLFVHGWTCDHTCFDPQLDYFKRTHRVVAVDLRGHGASDKPVQEYSMSVFADDLAWLCRQIELDRPVVIGHAMGGLVAIELATRHPALARAIVTLAAPVLIADAMLEALRPVVAALHTPGYREAQQRMVAEGLFLPSDDAQRKARILELMALAPQHVMASAFAHTVQYYQAMPVAACTVPWLALFATWVPDLARLRTLCPHVVTGQTVGAGAFHQLEVPDQVNAMIERFLTVSQAGVDKPHGAGARGSPRDT